MIAHDITRLTALLMHLYNTEQSSHAEWLCVIEIPRDTEIPKEFQITQKTTVSADAGEQVRPIDHGGNGYEKNHFDSFDSRADSYIGSLR